MNQIEKTYHEVKKETRSTAKATKSLMSVHGLSFDDAVDAGWRIEKGKRLSSAAWYRGLENKMCGE